MLSKAFSTIWPILLALLFFGIIIMTHEFGHFIFAKIFKVKVNEFSIGMGPALFKKKKGDTDYALSLFPIGGYVAMEGEDEDSADENSFNNKPAWQRAIIIIAGATINILTGVIIMAIILSSSKLIGTPSIAEFAKDATSSSYGLEEGDRIVAINGNKIYTEYDLSYFMMRDKDAVIDFVVERDGKMMPLRSVKFDTEKIEGHTVVKYDFSILGVKPDFKNVVKYSFMNSFSVARIVAVSFADLVTLNFSLNDLSGPVGTVDIIADTTSEAVHTMNFTSLLNMMAFIAINIGVFNLIPFPALDGGRFFLIAIEGVTGKKVPAKVEAAINATGLILLLGLMVVVTINDIIKFF